MNSKTISLTTKIRRIEFIMADTRTLTQDELTYVRRLRDMVEEVIGIEDPVSRYEKMSGMQNNLDEGLEDLDPLFTTAVIFAATGRVVPDKHREVVEALADNEDLAFIKANTHLLAEAAKSTVKS